MRNNGAGQVPCMDKDGNCMALVPHCPYCPCPGETMVGWRKGNREGFLVEVLY